MYIIIYSQKGQPRIYPLTVENENPLKLFKTKKEAKDLAKTLKKGEHRLQKPKKNCKICKGTGEMGRQGFPCDCNRYWGRLKNMQYKLIKL